MNIIEITNLVRTTEDALAFLRERGIIRAVDHPPICPACGLEMQLKHVGDINVGEVWRCQRRILGVAHSRKVSIRQGSFLENSNLPPWKNAKQKNKSMSAELLPSYLDEFQWRQMHGKKTHEAFDNILNQISIYYPVNK
uniref:Transposase n=1 Tax=Meloidogyne hapla TaxID=6305 RepID=A0A1I8BC29_MELHA